MTQRVRRRDARLRFWIPGVFLAVFLFTFLAQHVKRINEMADAASLANFDPGYIISDYQMGNYTSMSEAEIQAFLTAKNPCSNRDYNLYLSLSANPKYKWHFENGHFVCLSEERFGDGEVIGQGETAAHIIWQAAQDYRINPQVLIVLLQKETSLITDPIPNDGDYRKATGYGCPDTAPCSEQYYGFKNQVRKAAELFSTVLNGGWTNYPLGDNYVQYNPNPGCGGTVVNIRNLATSSLYRYTPYQPNPGAIAAGYGEAHCGAYGNRNFYLYFEDWFGGVTAELPKIQFVLATMPKVPDEATSVGFDQNTFVQYYGWIGATEGGKMLGTAGYNLRMEGAAFKLKEVLGIEYRSHIQNIGWENVMKRDGEVSGAPGSGLQIEAMQLNLYGEMGQKYDIYYRVHVQDIGWMEWVKNGAVAGTIGKALKIEAAQVKIVEKPTYVNISYVGHVQDYGWMEWVGNGAMAGTTGQWKRVEALNINLDGAAGNNNIRYRAHVEDYGWMDYVSGGTMVGTTGQSKRVEAIVIEPINGLEITHDIYYRVHVEDYGWMNWVKSGEIAGTTGQAKRIEAIEIKTENK